MQEKINKRKARKLFAQRTPFWITPCNAPYYCGVLVGVTGHTFDEFTSFDALVNAFEYYNCGNGCGRYAAFYTA